MRFLLLCLLFTLGTAWAGSPPALLTDLVGTVNTSRDGTVWSKAELLGEVEAGSFLKLDSGSQVTLHFVQGGRRARAKGPCRLQMSADGAKVVEGSPDLLSVLVPYQVSQSQPMLVGLNLDRMGGLRRGDLVPTFDPTSLGPTRLGWACLGTVQDVEVTIEEEGTYRRVARLTVPASQGEVKQDLPPGRYLVSLGGFEASGQRVPPQPQSTPLTVLSTKSAQDWQQARATAEKALREDLSLATLIYASEIDAGLWDDALALGKRILPQRPGIAASLEKLRSYKSGGK